MVMLYYSYLLIKTYGNQHQSIRNSTIGIITNWICHFSLYVCTRFNTMPQNFNIVLCVNLNEKKKKEKQLIKIVKYHKKLPDKYKIWYYTFTSFQPSHTGKTLFTKTLLTWNSHVQRYLALERIKYKFVDVWLAYYAAEPSLRAL